MDINTTHWIEYLKDTAGKLKKQESLEDKRHLFVVLAIDIFLGFLLVRKLIENKKLTDWSVRVEDCQKNKDKVAAKTRQMSIHEISSRIIHCLTYKYHVSADGLRIEGVYFNSELEKNLIYLSLPKVIEIFNSSNKDMPCVTVSKRTGRIKFYKKKTLRFPKDYA